MLKFPYVIEYKLFEKIDLLQAEDLLNEYTDFYEYNRTQVGQYIGSQAQEDDTPQPQDENEAKIIAERIAHNRSVCVDHFEKHFGSKDFAEACLMGLKIDFYALQEILISEQRRGIPITSSSINIIAPKLRVLASILLFAERIVGGLERLTEVDKLKEKAQMAAEFAREGFNLLLERTLEQDIAVPEFNGSKKELSKIKTVDGYVDYCEKLFFTTEG